MNMLKRVTNKCKATLGKSTLAINFKKDNNVQLD